MIPMFSSITVHKELSISSKTHQLISVYAQLSSSHVVSGVFDEVDNVVIRIVLVTTTL